MKTGSHGLLGNIPGKVVKCLNHLGLQFLHLSNGYNNRSTSGMACEEIIITPAKRGLALCSAMP